MIFIGYSKLDRYTVVESIMFHLKSYGLSVWYDFHSMFLGDARWESNFEKGIGESQYVVFIVTKNLFSSKCGVEELNYARDLYERAQIVLFPILYGITADQIPEEYTWLRRIIYNEITDQTGTLYVTNQIAEKILYDESGKLPYKSFSHLTYYLNSINETYLSSITQALGDVDLHNYNARLGILYCSYLYCISRWKTEHVEHCHSIIKKIYKLTSLNISIDHLSYRLFELAVLILVNKCIDNVNNSLA